jgi:arsenate reductase
MAEALLRLIAGDDFEAESAGAYPAGLHPMTVVSMHEIGLDVRNYRSKILEEFVGQSFNYVITVCDRAKESCPVFPGAVNIRHWSFDDPAAASLETRLEVFRRVRDEIANRLCQFLIEEVRFTPAVRRPLRPLLPHLKNLPQPFEQDDGFVGGD